MNATEATLANILQTTGVLDHYHVPKYQREYTWGSNEWEILLNDIEENSTGYFMGSIICINDNEELGPGESKIYEVVDGQQRLTTITLMLMAIYKKIKNLKEAVDVEDEEEVEKYNQVISDIRRQLVYRKAKVNNNEKGYFEDRSSKDKYVFLRVQPSTQSQNLKDYLHVMSELGIIKGEYRTNYCTVRKIYKAFEYIYEQLPDTFEELEALIQKINSLKFVHISVGSSSDAFVLFETLNNRGIPLSAMDIIKNKMLSTLEKNHNMNIDDAYLEWQQLLKYIPEYSDQERFLRQYYNAFKTYPGKKVGNHVRATRSNLINIYESYIKTDAKKTLEMLLDKAEIYHKFIDPDVNDMPDLRKKLLLDLRRVGSAPSYTFLLYLWSLPPEHINDREKSLDEVVKFLIKYYLRRNITDYPNTRDLDAINMDAIDLCEQHINNNLKLTSDFIINKFMNARDKPSKISVLKDKLEDNLYYNNYGMARYVLAKIDEEFQTREYKPDLWARSPKGLHVWTVEHVLPQTANMSKEWVDMIAEGDIEKALEIHGKWVHCLGNLTLSGYNSQLSTASFEKKQSLLKNRTTLGHSINIGYKNGLSLNKFPFEVNGNTTSLADIDAWTEDSIQARNKAMVDFLLKMFAFNPAELSEVLQS